MVSDTPYGLSFIIIDQCLTIPYIAIMTTVDEIKNHILFSGASKEDIKTFISERIENLSEEEVQKIHRLLQQWSKNSRPKTETIDGVIVKKAAL